MAVQVVDGVAIVFVIATFYWAYRSVGQGRFQLQAVLCDHQRIDRELPGLAMELQLETIREEMLQHQIHLVPRGARWKRGDDVEDGRRDQLGAST